MKIQITLIPLVLVAIMTAGAVSAADKIPAGFRMAAGTDAEPYTGTGWAKEIVHEASDMAMVYVPAGSFLMGSPADEKPYRSPDEVQHKVTLTKGFYLGKFEVTQGQWELMMDCNVQQQWKKAGKTDPLIGIGADMPMYYISWNETKALCEKLGTGFRLPTEAEWEYACRSGTTDPHAGPIEQMAWTADNSGLTPIRPDVIAHSRREFVDILLNNSCGVHPVGEKKPNDWGLYDMEGNLLEWCQDWYGPLTGAAVSDPTGPTTPGSNHVSRGGSWFDFAGYIVRSACRECNDPAPSKRTPDWRGFTHGARIAFDPEPSAKSVGALHDGTYVAPDYDTDTSGTPPRPPVASGGGCFLEVD